MSCLCICSALEKSARGTLKEDSGSFLAHLFRATATQNATPPSLDDNGLLAKVLVVLVCDPAADVLLDQRDKGIEAGGTERLQQGNHTRSEEDLGETDLVLVLILESSLQ